LPCEQAARFNVLVQITHARGTPQVKAREKIVKTKRELV
jgi:hypothetical protein